MGKAFVRFFLMDQVHVHVAQFSLGDDYHAAAEGVRLDHFTEATIQRLF